MITSSRSGIMGKLKEMDGLVSQIATKLSVKRDERYSDTVGFLRKIICFDLHSAKDVHVIV